MLKQIASYNITSRLKKVFDIPKRSFVNKKILFANIEIENDRIVDRYLVVCSSIFYPRFLKTKCNGNTSLLQQTLIHGFTFV